MALKLACLERSSADARERKDFGGFNTSRVAINVCPATSSTTQSASSIVLEADNGTVLSLDDAFQYHYNDEIEAQSLECYVPDDDHLLPLGRISRDSMIACFCDYQHANSF
jgi:hypothetical protein